MDARSEMLRRLDMRREGFTLDQKFYGDVAFHELDMEHIYYREWLFVGHECELASPGDYFTVQIGGYSIIVLRRDDGTIGAVHNSCRHRGSRICRADHGQVAKRLICPYHQWTYHLDGRLASARQMGRPIDADQLGLKPVHCEGMAGYVFVSLAPVPPTSPRFAKRSSHISCLIIYATPKLRSAPRSSRRAIGNSCGKTIVSAITARSIIRSCAKRIPSGRP
jgi:glycine betaine catabolism A